MTRPASLLLVIAALRGCVALLSFGRALPREVQLSAAPAPSSPSLDGLFGDWDEFHIRQVSSVESLSFIDVPPPHRQRVGQLSPSSSFTYGCRAYRSDKIRFARTITFTGQGFNVFNLLILPRPEVRLPLLGVDIVYLPKHHVVAIDFQPQSSSPDYFQLDAYRHHSEVFERWRSRYNDSVLPMEVSRYFSPYAFWRKASHSDFGELPLYGDCFREYLSCYCDALSKTAFMGNGVPSEQEFQREYLEYRIRDDPAKGILIRCFGEEWTHEALTKYFFPVDEEDQI